MKIIETRDLTKMYGDFVANDKISISVEEGEIRAIVGENGAGKTTLMNMLYGMIQPTSGEILIRGQPVKIHSPKDAIAKRIGMVHQHFKLVPSLTIYENILLGVERLGKVGNLKVPFVSRKREIEEVAALAKKYSFQLNPTDRIQDISIGMQQRVEILKMLYRDVDILILDEPTAVLTPQEVDELLENLRELKKQGKTIILITHKLGEVKKIADTCTVIRRGQVVCDVVKTDEVDEKELAVRMVGRQVNFTVQKAACQLESGAPAVYEAKGLRTIGADGQEVLHGVDFCVRAGEVLGVAGVEGNGQSELVILLTGLMDATGGSVSLCGADITGQYPEKLRQEGVAIISEDRFALGLCAEMKISSNMVAGYHMNPPYCNHQLMDYKTIRQTSAERVREFDIRTPGDITVGGLSGGNAQKVVVARELSSDPKVLIAAQPTRGVDVGSIEFIHKKLIELRDEGKAVLLVSSELSEIMSLSDRVVVMYCGQITGEFCTADTTQEELGLYMMGVKTQREEGVG